VEKKRVQKVGRRADNMVFLYESIEAGPPRAQKKDAIIARKIRARQIRASMMEGFEMTMDF